VLLCEQHDLAQHTSSNSTKLIHGGLRYLEYYEFGLVRKALAERERAAPQRAAHHVAAALRDAARPVDAAGVDDPRRPLPVRPPGAARMAAGSYAVDLRARRRRAAAATFTQGFVYSDGWVDDARLVVLNAIDAAERGATILTRCPCVRAVRSAQGWQSPRCSPRAARESPCRRAPGQCRRALGVAVPGPRPGRRMPRALRLVKGSHIVVRRLFEHDHAYIFQNPDKRIIFAIPYEGEFTLIGTTDVEHHGAIGQAHIDADEVRYLCEQASRYFAKAVQPADVVWSYAGVRPLLDDEQGDASAVTRDYSLELDTGGGAPLLNVWGGKLTTFRKLAEEAADRVCGALGHAARHWTEHALFPGGDLSAWVPHSTRPDHDIAAFAAELARRHPELPDGMRRRWVRSYGSRVQVLLQQPLGAEVAPGLFEAELRHLHDHEWARSADDVLWRRSKLGLHYSVAQTEAVSRWWHAAGYAQQGATLETTWN
jgi:glycerol-3-phosphate dehydrogenase